MRPVGRFFREFLLFPAKIPRDWPMFPWIGPWKSREILLFFLRNIRSPAGLGEIHHRCAWFWNFFVRLQERLLQWLMILRQIFFVYQRTIHTAWRERDAIGHRFLDPRRLKETYFWLGFISGKNVLWNLWLCVYSNSSAKRCKFQLCFYHRNRKFPFIVSPVYSWMLIKCIDCIRKELKTNKDNTASVYSFAFRFKMYSL